MSIAPCPIYLINLDRDPERLKAMSAQLARLDLAFERVPAVLGLEMPEWIRPYFLGADGEISSRLRRGEIGCYASHLVVAQRMIETGHPIALVFEDDLELPPDLTALVAAASNKVPPGWDIIRLSNPPKSPYVSVVDLPGGRDLALYTRVPNNTGASLLSLSGARKLLQPGRRTLQIDEHLRRPWLLGMETYGIVPAPIRSNIFEGSTIDAMESRGLARESALAKLGRRHLPSPVEILTQIRWQTAHLGVIGWLNALLIGLKQSLGRKLTGKRSETADERSLRLPTKRK